jgi:hypothetical protein
MSPEVVAMDRVEHLAEQVASLSPSDVRSFLEHLERRLRIARGDQWKQAAEEFISKHKPALQELARR